MGNQVQRVSRDRPVCLSLQANSRESTHWCQEVRSAPQFLADLANAYPGELATLAVRRLTGRARAIKQGPG